MLIVVSRANSTDDTANARRAAVGHQSAGVLNPVSLVYANISAGGSASADGTVTILDFTPTGLISNSQYKFEIGPLPIILLSTTGSGDLEDDGFIMLDDFGDGFKNCLAGPSQGYPSLPYCWRFDMNRDGHVDIRDTQSFQNAFTGNNQ